MTQYDNVLRGLNRRFDLKKTGYGIALEVSSKGLGSAGHKENPETIAVSGFLKFDMRDRLSLGAVIRHVKTVFLRENRGIE